MASTEKVRRPTRVDTSSTTLPFPAQTDDAGVEVGVLHAVPEVGRLEVELGVCALGGGDNVSGRIQQLNGEDALALVPRSRPGCRPLPSLRAGVMLHAGVAEVAQRDVVLAGPPSG